VSALRERVARLEGLGGPEATEPRESIIQRLEARLAGIRERLGIPEEEVDVSEILEDLKRFRENLRARGVTP
jgi:hypothetical protein